MAAIILALNKAGNNPPPIRANRLAAEEIPSKAGSAMGFLSAAWKKAPLTARAAPPKRAEIMRGKRMLNKMFKSAKPLELAPLVKAQAMVMASSNVKIR